MPNPASVYCKQNGNTLEIHTAADGSQSGVCVFPDGSTCDEWAYYRGECGPHKNLPRPLRQPQKQVVVAQEEVVAQKKMDREVTCHPVPRKR